MLSSVQRLIAAAFAVSVTFSIVWSSANLAYPEATPARAELMARAEAT